MKLVEMTPLEVKHPTQRGAKLYIPGGWQAFVGEVSLDGDTLRIYSDYLGSDEAAASIAQRIFEGGFLVGLRAAIARRAQEYAELFPELVVEEKRFRTSQRYYVLEGFDPAEAQQLYVPFDNPGREGKSYAREMLQRMGEAALAEREAP